jgi:hypothetical protein
LEKAATDRGDLRGSDKMNKSMTMTDTAAAFFDTIETGRGWAACAPFCRRDATFSCQSDALAEIGTIEAYAGWMEGLLKLAAIIHEAPVLARGAMFEGPLLLDAHR